MPPAHGPPSERRSSPERWERQPRDGGGGGGGGGAAVDGEGRRRSRGERDERIPSLIGGLTCVENDRAATTGKRFIKYG